MTEKQPRHTSPHEPPTSDTLRKRLSELQLRPWYRGSRGQYLSPQEVSTGLKVSDMVCPPTSWRVGVGPVGWVAVPCLWGAEASCVGCSETAHPCLGQLTLPALPQDGGEVQWSETTAEHSSGGRVVRLGWRHTSSCGESSSPAFQTAELCPFW